MKQMSKQTLRAAFRDTLPVMTGYLVLGTGFGILMKTQGYGTVWALAMSLFVYAGSMQYASLGLFAGGASLVTVALTTLAVNARHLFYGVSMESAYRHVGKSKPYLIFSLTDETYSLVCGGDKSRDYCLAVSVLDHVYWVTGTLIGSLAGSVFPFDTKGMDFALTALFLTIFTDRFLNDKQHFPALAGIVSSVACRLIFGADAFLIPSMAVILVILLLGKRGMTHER